MIEVIVVALVLLLLVPILVALSPIIIILAIVLWPRKLRTNSNNEQAPLKKQKVLIVGAGAAGTAAAWSLSQHPERFEVEVWEASDCAGGQATSEKVVSPFVNDGVQGAAPSYHNTLQLHEKYGFKPNPVDMMISFGKNETYWNNYPGKETELTKRLAPEIKRFGRVLRIISFLEPLFVAVPINTVLRVFWFSADFRNLMVFPLVALFFGTGNQTPRVSAAIIARVFLDDELRLFEYDEEALLSQTPRMYAFQELNKIYKTIHGAISSKLFLNRPVAKVVRSSSGVSATAEDGTEGQFDQIIFACSAETVLQVLESPSRMEKWTLGNVRYYDDVTLTHTDQEYMEKHYDIDLKRNDQYFIYTDPKDRSKIEMSFNLSNYQPQLGDDAVFQTIFLDKSKSESWTIDAIDKSKVVLTKWWRQFAHTWTHFVFAVPYFRFIQGHKNTYYIGSYTLINTHEIATISGFAAAARLGAPYPFAEDKLALQQFNTYLRAIHGKYIQPTKTSNERGTSV